MARQGRWPSASASTGCSGSWLSRRVTEKDGHLCPGRPGRHCLAEAETQDISRNQQVPASLPASLRVCLRAGGSLGPIHPLCAGYCPLPPSMGSPVCSVAWEADLRGQHQWATWPSASGRVQPVGGPAASRREGSEARCLLDWLPACGATSGWLCSKGPSFHQVTSLSSPLLPLLMLHPTPCLAPSGRGLGTASLPPTPAAAYPLGFPCALPSPS